MVNMLFSMFNGNDGNVIQFGVQHWLKLHSFLTLRKTVVYIVEDVYFVWRLLSKYLKTKEHCLVFSPALQTLSADSNKWYKGRVGVRRSATIASLENIFVY